MKIASFILASLLNLAVAHAEVASIYGGADGLCGSMTASGERFNCSAMTAAMLSTKERPIPLGTWVRVTHAGRSVTVRINDRGPWIHSRSIDLSPVAAKRIGCDGLCEVQIEITKKPFQPESRLFRGTL